MPIPVPVLPYGLRDVRLTPLGADGSTPGTGVDLPVARTFSFKETESFSELRGDDKVVAAHGSGPVVEWDLEAGGLSLEAYAVMAGGSVTTTGVTPVAIKTYRKTAVQTRPYFKVEGQALGDTGGDLHGLVYKCKADSSLEGGFSDGNFLLTKGSGKGYPSTEAAKTDFLYDFIQNETAAAII